MGKKEEVRKKRKGKEKKIGRQERQKNEDGKKES